MTEKLKQGGASWHKARAPRVTASSAGAILNVDAFRNRDDVMRRMVRDWHNAPSEFDGNVATQHGNFHEAGARVEYEMETEAVVETCGFFVREDWAGASPDGLIGDDGLIEIKCPFSKRKDEHPTFKTLREQPGYYAQVMFQLWVTDRQWCDFYQWAPGGTRLERVKIDQEWLDWALPALKQFHAEYLDTRDGPTAQEHLEPKRKIVDTPEAHKMVREYDELVVAIEMAEDRKKELLAEMVQVAGDRNALFAGRNLTRVDRVGGISYAKAIKKYAPEADLEPFRGQPSSYWVMK